MEGNEHLSKMELLTNTCSNHEETTMSGVSFPSKLHKFLSTVNDSNVASWQPHGRCFRICRPKEFVKLSNPSWFKYTKYSSFQRQLNIYGFLRITKGVDKNCYYHRYFLRGNPTFLHKIKRVPVKKNDKPHSSSPRDPGFYSMPFATESTTTLFNVDSQIENSAVVANNVNNEGNVRNEAVNRHAESKRGRKPENSIEFLQEMNLVSWLQSQNKCHTNSVPVTLVPMSQSLYPSAMLGHHLLSLGSAVAVAPLVYLNLYDSTGMYSRDYNLYSQYSTGQLNSQENKCNSASPLFLPVFTTINPSTMTILEQMYE